MKVTDIELYKIRGTVDLEPAEGALLMGVTELGRGKELITLGRLVTLLGVDKSNIAALRAGEKDALNSYLRTDKGRPGVYRFVGCAGILKTEKDILGEKSLGSRGLLEVKEVPPYSPSASEAAYLASVLEVSANPA